MATNNNHIIILGITYSSLITGKEIQPANSFEGRYTSGNSGDTKVSLVRYPQDKYSKILWLHKIRPYHVIFFPFYGQWGARSCHSPASKCHVFILDNLLRFRLTSNNWLWKVDCNSKQCIRINI